MKISNTLPWKQEKVGPGLNVGYNTKSVGGLNAGCGSRNARPRAAAVLRDRVRR